MHAVHAEVHAAGHQDVVFSEVVDVEHHGVGEVLVTHEAEGPHGVATVDGVEVEVVAVFQVGAEGGEVDNVLAGFYSLYAYSGWACQCVSCTFHG